MIYCKLLVVMFSALFACPMGPVTAPHPFHVTRAEIEYNGERNTFEVALCVWPEDLEKAISKMEDRDVSIDVETEADRDSMFKKYVAAKFQFSGRPESKRIAATPKGIRWVGSEIKVKQGWLYFEVPADASMNDWTIENRMFFELNDDQLNQIQIQNGKLMTSQTLSVSQPSVGWSRGKRASDSVKRGMLRTWRDLKQTKIP